MSSTTENVSWQLLAEFHNDYLHNMISDLVLKHSFINSSVKYNDYNEVISYNEVMFSVKLSVKRQILDDQFMRQMSTCSEQRNPT